MPAPLTYLFHPLFPCTIVAAGVGDAGDEPLAVLADEVEEVGAAVLDFAVDEEVEGRPDDGEIVVDFDERVVDPLFDLLGAGLADAVAKSSKVICAGLPSRIRTMTPPGSVGFLMAAASRADMPANMAWIGARTAWSCGVSAGVAWRARGKKAARIGRMAMRRRMAPHLTGFAVHAGFRIHQSGAVTVHLSRSIRSCANREPRPPAPEAIRSELNGRAQRKSLRASGGLFTKIHQSTNQKSIAMVGGAQTGRQISGPKLL